LLNPGGIGVGIGVDVEGAGVAVGGIRVWVGRGVSVGAVVSIPIRGSVVVGWGAPQAANNSMVAIIKNSTT
jgi:hypothetical protein